MRIVNKKDFLKLPPNTLFQSYSSVGNLGYLCIKGDTIISGGKEYDFYYSNLSNNIDDDNYDNYTLMWFDIEEGLITDFSFDYNCYERYGFFDDNDKFLVYNKQDVENLYNVIKTLKNAIS
jgi:hypothetical protein